MYVHSKYTTNNKILPGEAEVRSSELDDVLEVNDNFHLDVDNVFELKRVLEFIFI